MKFIGYECRVFTVTGFFCQSPWFDRTIWEGCYRRLWVARLMTKLACWRAEWTVPYADGHIGIKWTIHGLHGNLS